MSLFLPFFQRRKKKLHHHQQQHQTLTDAEGPPAGRGRPPPVGQHQPLPLLVHLEQLERQAPADQVLGRDVVGHVRARDESLLALDVDHQARGVERGDEPLDGGALLEGLALAPPDQGLLGPADRELELARALVLAQDDKLARVARGHKVGGALDAGDGELAGGAEGRGLGPELDVDALAVDAVGGEGRGVLFSGFFFFFWGGGGLGERRSQHEEKERKKKRKKRTSRRRRRVGKREGLRMRAFRGHDSSTSIDWAHAGTYRCALADRSRQMHEQRQAGRNGARVKEEFEKQPTSFFSFFFPLVVVVETKTLFVPRHGPGDLVSALRRKGRGVEELVKLLVEVGGGTVVDYRGKKWGWGT